MKYRIESKINDGKAEAPPIEVSVEDVAGLLDEIAAAMCNDYDEPFGPGSTLLVERLA